MPKLSTKLSVYEFGARLLETNDLDPIYLMLHCVNVDKDQMQLWLLAYWCFYHSGTASWIVDQPDYWEAMFKAAGSKDYLRCSERRHFRGDNALNSVSYLSQEDVEQRLNPIMNGTQIPANEVMAYVKQWTGFGPWIAFKVADMIERLGFAQVLFDVNNIEIFKSPREGAELMYLMYGDPKIKPTNIVSWAINKILQKLNPFKAPPRYERLINVQEAETILCKWHSYMNGHYIIGEDIEALKKSLTHYKDSRTSKRLLSIVNDLWKESHA